MQETNALNVQLSRQNSNARNAECIENRDTIEMRWFLVQN